MSPVPVTIPFFGHQKGVLWNNAALFCVKGVVDYGGGCTLDNIVHVPCGPLFDSACRPDTTSLHPSQIRRDSVRSAYRVSQQSEGSVENLV